MKRGPCAAVDPLKVDLISLEPLTALELPLVVELRLKPDIGLRVVGVLLIA